MNSPAPVLSPQLSLFGRLLVDVAVGAAIRAGTGGDAGKLYAHAQAAVQVADGFAEITAGDPADVTSGLTAIDAAVESAISSGVDPGVALALSNGIAFANSKVAAFAEVFSGTAPGVLASQIASGIATEVGNLAAKYPQPATSNAAAAAVGKPSA